MMTASREIRLAQRPKGRPTPAEFAMATVDVPAPGPGEVQVKNLYMSVDPYMRGRMNDTPSYVPPFEIGKALQGGAIGEVAASNAEGFAPGDLVSSFFGWREAFNAPSEQLVKLDAQGLPPQVFLGAAGMPGMTAYFGLLKVAEMKAGDVVFVSAASGAVGQIACQIAKLKGATVIGSAGGAEKIAYLKSIGVDAAIDYKAEPDLTAALARAAPKGVDVYFENVGGAHLQAALAVARPFARFAMCGMIAQYNADAPQPGPTNLMVIVGKRLRLQGFIVSDFAAHQGEFLAEMTSWLTAGQITVHETIDQGIEAAPGAFLKLFDGGNFGKMLVKL